MPTRQVLSGRSWTKVCTKLMLQTKINNPDKMIVESSFRFGPNNSREVRSGKNNLGSPKKMCPKKETWERRGTLFCVLLVVNFFKFCPVQARLFSFGYLVWMKKSYNTHTLVYFLELFSEFLPADIDRDSWGLGDREKKVDRKFRSCFGRFSWHDFFPSKFHLLCHCWAQYRDEGMLCNFIERGVGMFM